ncbi:MAG: hypothetical protein L3K26_03015 [Candidatus Hydrogenedentes bacterium]|nr:hypothetical protein [Candidatus Hydrogenedentota bacterium]
MKSWSKVLKFIHAETEGVSTYGRDLLESFPDKETVPPAFELMSESPEEEAEDMPLDPEAIRAEIMESARIEAEQKVQEAYQEGLARGTEAGQKSFEESLAQCTEALTAAGDALQETHAAFLESLEPQVLSLVKHIVAKVIDVERIANPEILQHTVQRALELLTEEQKVTLSLNPQDLEAMRAHEVSLLETFPRLESLALQADESVEPGGCVANTETTSVDARLETILAQVLDSLTE